MAESSIKDPNTEREVWLVLGSTLSKAKLEKALAMTRPAAEAIQATHLLQSTLATVGRANARLKFSAGPDRSSPIKRASLHIPLRHRFDIVDRLRVGAKDFTHSGDAGISFPFQRVNRPQAGSRLLGKELSWTKSCIDQ